MMTTDKNGKEKTRALVIGAGAAGLAAGRRLKEAGYEVVLLEARDRVGGRAWSNYDMAPHPVEMGAEWVNGYKVVTWSLLREYGLHTLHEQNWEQFGAYVDEHLLGVQAFRKRPHAGETLLLSAVDEAAQAWQKAGRPDASLSDAWNLDQLDAGMRTLLRHRIMSDFAAEPELVGVHGWLEGDSASDGEGFFRIVEGYSRLMECLAGSQDVRLNTPIARIEWNESGVTVQTKAGEIFQAECAVVTLPLGVLQAGDVTFDPALPAEKQAAISGLGAGKVNKLILRFTEKFWPDEMDFLLTTLDSQTWYRPGAGRDNEANILTGYVGGEISERFTAMGENETIRESLRQLEQMHGVKDLNSQLESAKFVTWAKDEYSKMAYTYVPVDGVGLRDKLAAPLDQVLFFAGEATNRDNSGYVHGALESGFRAADEVIG